MGQWQPFPYDASPYTFAGDELQEHWNTLHGGDQVAFPDKAHVSSLLEQYPSAAPADFDGDLGGLSDRLQSAWRHYHAGSFGEAIDLALTCGVPGHAIANKSTGIYAHYLLDDEEQQRDLYMEAAQRAEAAISALPDDANAYYFHAFNLGRYSQSISIVNALRQGIGGKIQDSLDQALALEPDHAEAHIALGLYNAEIIEKIGKMIGSMTYGASAAKAIDHFEKAIELTPNSPIAHIEYGNGLYMLYGDKKLDDVTDLYVKATEMEPRDAMEKLDIESALAELE